MDPALILMIGNLLLKYGPFVTEELILLFQKSDPKPEDWSALFIKAKEEWKEYQPPTIP